MAPTMTGKQAFEKVCESQALSRSEWWLYWPFFKAGVDYERKREKLRAPVVTTSTPPAPALGLSDKEREALAD
jgi:hypothetical protein